MNDLFDQYVNGLRLTGDLQQDVYLSMYMARDIFGMADGEILAAIESHTTHRANAGWTAKLLFAADKLSWKLPGEHPHLTEMRKRVDALDIDGAVLIYLNHIWEQREKLKLVHPWLVEAREELLAGNG